MSGRYKHVNEYHYHHNYIVYIYFSLSFCCPVEKLKIEFEWKL